MEVAKPPRRLPLKFLLLAFLIAIIIGGLAFGSVRISPANLLATISQLLFAARSGWTAETIIVWQLRLPRVLLAATVGASLATAGAILQGILRNSMADSYILGVSAGASLGAATAMYFGLKVTLLGLGSVATSALIGALAATFSVISIATRIAKKSTLSMLLTGIAMSSFLSAVVSLMVYISKDRIQPMIFWLMGSFAARGWPHLFLALPYLVVGYGIAIIYHRQLTAISLSDATAHNLGVNVSAVRLILLIATSILTAASVAVSGVIGFVGLMIPHVARTLVGHEYRLVLPVSAIIGAIFLAGADILARTVLRPVELPVG
ncbi:MAG: iron ABC transporter permease, partial [bacterium]|nr:iron ABC transporter permease [bacterium]